MDVSAILALDERRPSRVSGLLPAIATLLLLAACSESGSGMGGESASDARQLNEAAAMLDEDSVSSNMVDAPDNQTSETAQ